MKKIFFLISFAFLLVTNAVAQTYITIPDADFRTFLITKYPACFNTDNEMDITCMDITTEISLNLTAGNVVDLEGIQYFTSLQTLACASNKITHITSLPSELTYWSCSSNSLTTLPVLPDNLQYLECSYNKLEQLPSLPNSLTGLVCDYNILKSLPILPSGLTYISCTNNKLESLSTLPNSLLNLYCNDNFLTTLPAISDQLNIQANGNCLVNVVKPATHTGSFLISPNRYNCNPGSGPNFVVIPDQYFRAVLEQKYGQCFNEDDKMDITCPVIVNETTLNINGRNVSDITGIEYFTSLTTFDMGLNGMVDISNLPASITWLNCSLNYLESIAKLPNNLTYLSCASNSLKNISYLPATLTYLDCSVNPYLSSLPSLPDGLQKIYCQESGLTSFPAMPVSLEYLTCYGNKLITLPALPDNLEYLDCYSNVLTSLTSLSTNLTHFDCHDNKLTILPKMSTKLDNVDCSQNALISLPALPVNLQFLDCHKNALTALPSLPINLASLYCFDNKLKTLPLLPVNLSTLNCRENELTNFPALPANMIYLECSYNFLKILPSISNSSSSELTKPDFLQWLIADHNCFDIVYQNPNPSMLIPSNFSVEPNRIDCSSIATAIYTPQSAVAIAEVYPNPATDKITVVISSATSIIIYNAVGEIVLQKNISGSEEIDIHNFTSGVYYYKLGSTNGKLIVR